MDGVDAYLQAEMEKLHIPGLSVAVVSDSKVVLARGYGLANVELSVPATPESVYKIGSITKPFTAAAIMMFAEEGKIGLDDAILQHLHDLPPAWSGITVRHLLTHTSGIKNFTNIANYPSIIRKDLAPGEIIELVLELPLDFRPGERFAYCNTGYTLLGMIIEKVAGKPYGEFMAERVFQPLQMTVTRLNDFRDIIPNRVSGYKWANNENELWNCEFDSPTHLYASGGLVSSVLDMAKWDAALSTEALLKKSSLDQIWTPVRLNGGETSGYGFGWFLLEHGSRNVVQHSGGTLGFLTNISRFVDDRLTVIVLTNLDSGDPFALATGVADEYFSS
jgi:D-alanyl-D-alanine carboxypeptidase